MKTCILMLLLVGTFFSYGHSGRTDSRGGHNGPGGYHYHTQDSIIYSPGRDSAIKGAAGWPSGINMNAIGIQHLTINVSGNDPYRAFIFSNGPTRYLHTSTLTTVSGIVLRAESNVVDIRCLNKKITVIEIPTDVMEKIQRPINTYHDKTLIVKALPLTDGKYKYGQPYTLGTVPPK